MTSNSNVTRLCDTHFMVGSHFFNLTILKVLVCTALRTFLRLFRAFSRKFSCNGSPLQHPPLQNNCSHSVKLHPRRSTWQWAVKAARHLCLLVRTDYECALLWATPHGNLMPSKRRRNGESPAKSLTSSTSKRALHDETRCVCHEADY